MKFIAIIITLLNLCFANFKSALNLISTEKPKIKRNNITLIDPNLVILTCKNPKQFSLTFDDGPNTLTKKHLEFFDRKNIKVTFFFIANRLNDPKMLEIVQLGLKKGHQIGNHNYYHESILSKIKSLNKKEILEYMKKSTKIFYEKLGVAPKYFRPPYGDINNEIVKLLNKLNFKIALWNLDTKDWYWEKPGRDKLNIVKSFIDAIFKSSKGNGFKSFVSLQHEKSNNLEAEYERLNYIIDLIRMNGYKIVPLYKCLNDKNPYFDKKQLAVFKL